MTHWRSQIPGAAVPIKLPQILVLDLLLAIQNINVRAPRTNAIVAASVDAPGNPDGDSYYEVDGLFDSARLVYEAQIDHLRRLSPRSQLSRHFLDSDGAIVLV